MLKNKDLEVALRDRGLDELFIIDAVKNFGERNYFEVELWKDNSKQNDKIWNRYTSSSPDDIDMIIEVQNMLYLKELSTAHILRLFRPDDLSEMIDVCKKTKTMSYLHDYDIELDSPRHYWHIELDKDIKYMKLHIADNYITNIFNKIEYDIGVDIYEELVIDGLKAKIFGYDIVDDIYSKFDTDEDVANELIRLYNDNR